MATKTSIPVSSVQASSSLDEGTPLLVSASEDKTSAPSPTTTFSGATISTTGTLAVNTTVTISGQSGAATKITQRQSSPLNRSPFIHQKVEEIELLLSQPDIDLWKLREFALSPGGLVNGTILNTIRNIMFFPKLFLLTIIVLFFYLIVNPKKILYENVLGRSW